MIKFTSSEREVLIDILEKNEFDCGVYGLVMKNYLNNLQDIERLRKLTRWQSTLTL